MSTTLEAIFDGDVFRPTKPVNLKPNTKVEIIISDEREEWINFSANSLNGAFGSKEPEYSASSVKEKNPEYEGS